MDMTKFRNVDDPGFKAIVAEIRRWVKAMGTRVPGADDGGGSSERESSGRLPLRITQGGSDFRGSVTVTGGILLQGNSIGFDDGRC